MKINTKVMKTVILISALLLSFSFAFSQSCIVANYPISGNANDISGNSYDGTTYNVVLDTNRFGTANSSYSFNGSNSYIDLPNDFDINTRSINLWFNARTIDVINRHIYISDNSGLSFGSTQLIVYEDAGSKHIRFTTGLSAGMVSVPVSENTWYMATIARGIDSTVYYLNGVRVGVHINGNEHSASGHSTAMLGVSRLMDRYFDGLIDDVTIYNCQLTPFQVDSLFSISDSTNCLLASYPFDGNANDTTINGLNGTPYNVSSAINRFGAPAGAYNFDGTDSYIELPEDFDLPERSINLWFKADTIDDEYRHIYVSDNSGTVNGSTQIVVYRLSGTTYIRYTTGLSSGMVSVPVVQNTWNMATLVRNADSTYYYLNGTLVGSHINGNEHSTSGSTNALIGTSRLFDRYFAGDIDDVQIFDCALTASDIENFFDVTSIAENQKSTTLTVFPNPSDGEFSVKIPETLTGCSVSIFDSHGKMVFHSENNSAGIILFSMKEFSSGLYFLKLQNSSISTSGTVVIQK